MKIWLNLEMTFQILPPSDWGQIQVFTWKKNVLIKMHLYVNMFIH